MIDKVVSKNRDLVWHSYEIHKFPIDIVAIETSGRCNRNCSFCPVSKHPPRIGKLDLEIITSVFEQLSTLKYTGQLRLHFYNEPLIDKRLTDIIRIMRKYLPNNFFRLTTNGDILNIKKAQELISAGVSQIKISLYDKKNENKVSKLKSNNILSEKILISKYYQNNSIHLTNRGGEITSNDSSNIKIINGADTNGCNRVQYNIDYMGNVHPCCHDFIGGYILGNIHNNSLIDIWKKNKYNYKDHFIGNYTKEVCKKCVGIL